MHLAPAVVGPPDPRVLHHHQRPRRPQGMLRPYLSSPQGDEVDNKYWVSAHTEADAKKKVSLLPCATLFFLPPRCSSLFNLILAFSTHADTKAAERFGVAEALVSLRQDEDVLDTWCSSSRLLRDYPCLPDPLINVIIANCVGSLRASSPFLFLAGPITPLTSSGSTPVSCLRPVCRSLGLLLNAGHDILFFWVARMVMMCTKLTGKLPFTVCPCCPFPCPSDIAPVACIFHHRPFVDFLMDLFFSLLSHSSQPISFVVPNLIYGSHSSFAPPPIPSLALRFSLLAFPLSAHL